MKFALVSHVLPPSWSGQAMVIYRLLQNLDAEDYCLISSAPSAESSSAGNGYTGQLPGRHYYLQPEFRFRRGHRFGLKYLREFVNASLNVGARGRQIAKIARREKCEAIVACTGDLIDLPAAYLASRLAGVPFYLYMFDYYAYQFIEPERGLIARLLEPIIAKRSRAVIAPNETLRDDLHNRYGIEAAVIHNPCDLSNYEALPGDSRRWQEDGLRIIYTGAIYDAHFDAFRDLIAAIEMLGREDVKLHLYTAQSPDALAVEGICGPVVFHEHQPACAVPAIQREADILFLPLAFNSPYPEVIRTSSMGKLGEYLAARRPALVHAPKDSFVSSYFRRHECGLVVDQSDPALLSQAIDRLSRDAGLRERLSANAWRQAVSDFSVTKARSNFAALLKLAECDAGSKEGTVFAGMRN